MELLNNLRWLYATKKYDPNKKVSDLDLAKIKEAIRLSASSYGLQLFKVLEIENSDLRMNLRKASWEQAAITDASHLFVFCAFSGDLSSGVDEYVSLKAEVQNLDTKDLEGYSNFVKKKLNSKTSSERDDWTARQTYIALSNAMNACAELKIDSTPIEGFEAEEYNQILGQDRNSTPNPQNWSHQKELVPFSCVFSSTDNGTWCSDARECVPCESFIWLYKDLRGISSVGLERLLDRQEVTGSNPVCPT